MTDNTSSFQSSIDDALAEVLVSFDNGVEEVEAEVEVEVADDEALEEDNLEAETETVEVEDETEVEAETEEVEEETEETEEVDEEEVEEEDEILSLDPDMEVIIDGQKVKVSDALQMRADYTKKTQALSEERAAFEEEKVAFGEKSEYINSLEQAWADDPAEVVAGFASASEDSIQSLGDAVVMLAANEDLDPNMFIVQTVVRLISEDLVDPELREMLGFDDAVVSQVKDQAKQDKRIRKLEREVRGKSAPEQPKATEEDAISTARAQLEEQWDKVVSSNDNLSSLDETAQLKVRSEVAKLALDRGGIPLDVAYELLQAKQAKLEAEAAATKAAVSRKKAKTKAVSKPTNGSPAATPRNPSNVEDAIAEAFRELGG